MIQKLEWDSHFFNLNVGEITDFSASKNFDEFDLIYLKSNQDCSYEMEGFNHTFSETKVVFSKKIRATSVTVDQIRPTTEQDAIDDLYELAYQSGKYSRFRLDEKFTHSQFEKLYRTWVDNSVRKQFADEVLVFTNGNKIAGFVTYKSATTSAVIGLIAVSPDFQGQGIGTKLLQYVENNLAVHNIETLHIPTQLANKQACAFYSKQGFEITEKTYSKHYWKI